MQYRCVGERECDIFMDLLGGADEGKFGQIGACEGSLVVVAVGFVDGFKNVQDGPRFRDDGAAIDITVKFYIG
jgi:hypothetical protein